MIRRLYVHNFRCLENFELPIRGQASVLLIGKNGAGKTTVGLALEILQRIARGTNRVDDLVKAKDLAPGRTDVPMRFEIEVELDAKIYEYVIAFEFPKGFKELRILEEKLTVEGRPVYTREFAQVHLAKMNQDKEAELPNRLAFSGSADGSGTVAEGSFVHFQAMDRSYSHPSADTQLNIRRIKERDSATRILRSPTLAHGSPVYWLTHQPHIPKSTLISSK
ncbi:MAG: AAA family ATPase [Pyrinomonadaceae bacterium]